MLFKVMSTFWWDVLHRIDRLFIFQLIFRQYHSGWTDDEVNGCNGDLHSTTTRGHQRWGKVKYILEVTGCRSEFAFPIHAVPCWAELDYTAWLKYNLWCSILTAVIKMICLFSYLSWVAGKGNTNSIFCAGIGIDILLKWLQLQNWLIMMMKLTEYKQHDT